MWSRWLIRLAVFVALIAGAIPVTLHVMLRDGRSRRVEADFQKFVETQSDEIRVNYPDLIDRISVDQTLKHRIRIVRLSEIGISRGDDYSSLARLPNAEEIDVFYGHDAEAIRSVVKAASHMPSLKRATFYDCGPSSAILTELCSPTLEVLRIYHGGRDVIKAEDIATCQANNPSCKITVADDGK